MTLSFGARADDPPTPRKTVWSVQLPDGRRIVVEEIPSGIVSFYGWFVVEVDGNRNLLLYIPGFRGGYGFPPVPAEVQVLAAGLVDGKLVTVYNQIGRCWGVRAWITNDNDRAVKQEPFERLYSLPGPIPADHKDTSISEAMASATTHAAPDGRVLVTLTDAAGRSATYELRKVMDPPRWPWFEWVATTAPATRPTELQNGTGTERGSP